MKKLLFVLFISSLGCFGAAAQTLPHIEGMSLEYEEEAIDADTIALKVADYLFSSPLIRDDEERLKAARFLNRWMDMTPTYVFVIDEDVTDYFDGDADLKDLYMAALTRYTLRHPEDAEKEDKVSVEAMKDVLAYVNDEKNMVLLSRRMEKLVVANNKGQLEKVL